MYYNRVSHKKGQITIFIIIGIILIIGLSYVLITYSEKQAIESELRPKIANVPLEARPIADFVTVCLESVGIEGTRRVGDFGGYTNPSEIRDFAVHPYFPTESDGVQFAPESELVVPYWYYMKGDNEDNCHDCVAATKRPYLYERDEREGWPSVEGQIASYIEENLPTCLRSFEAFEKEQFVIEELGAPDVRVRVAEETVTIYAKYPLEIQKAGTKFEVNEFFTEVDIPLKRMYELATRLVDLQTNHTFLENNINNIISLYSSLDSQALPPIAASGLDYAGGTYWVKSSVAEQVSSLMEMVMPMLQVVGTRNYFPLSTGPQDTPGEFGRTRQVLRNNGMLIPLDEPYPDFEVRFVYLSDWWPLYFDLNCEGELCKPDSVSSSALFAFFGFQKYNFAYDVSVPVLVTITDPSVLEGKGYSFNFFMEANVRNNQALSVDEPLVTMPDLVVEDLTSTYFTSPLHRTSGYINVWVEDGMTKEGVHEAHVVYQCGEEVVQIGLTDHGFLREKFPRCLGGTITAKKLDYFSVAEPFDVLDEEEEFVNITLEPYREKNVTVKRYRMRKADKFTPWNLMINDKAFAESLDPQEEVIATLQRIPGPGEENFHALANIVGNQFVRDTDYSKNVKLVPGNYHVRLTSLYCYHPDVPCKLIIPRDERNVDGGPFTSGEKVVIERKEFNNTNKAPLGGADLTWELTAEQLDFGNTLVLYMIDVDIPGTLESNRIVEDLGEISKVDDYSQAYSQLLMPDMIKER